MDFPSYAVFLFIFSLKGISRMFTRGYVRLCVCSLTGSGVTDEAFVNSGHQYA